jgi:iron complex outermembrane recepter protein
MHSHMLSGARRSVLPVLVLVGLPAASALAQVQEITVSARRVEESLQEVPVSITALDDRTLETAGIRSLSDVTTLVPNLTFEAGPDGRRAAPTLRGIGLIDTRGFDNAVGVFIDGVYIAGRANQNVRLLDLQRVEVIRGPQSALYGRNTFAGAINYVTRKPDDDLRGSIEAIAAQDGRYELAGALSGPLASGLSGGISAAWTDDEGMFNNAGPLQNKKNAIGGGDSQSVMGTLRYQPRDGIDIVFGAFYGEERLDNRAMFVVPNNCGELDPTKTFPNNPANQPSYDTGVPAYRCTEIDEATPGTVSLSPDAYSFEGETTRLSLDMQFALGTMTLQSITAWSKNENIGKQDLDRTQVGEPYYGYIATADYTPPFVVFNPGTATNAGIANMNTYFGTQSTDQDYFSQELRLVSDPDQRLRWSTGLFFFDQTNTDPTLLALDASEAIDALGLPPEDITFMLVSETSPGNWLGVKNPIIPNQAFKDGSDLETLIFAKSSATQYSAFGSLEYDFTDTLIGTVELRYTYEERSLDNIFDNFFGSPTGSFKDDFSFWDPRFTLRWQSTDDLMLYGSIAKGTRSGGQNVAIADASLVPYDEESNWTYEVGAKTAWLDRRLQVNAALFYIDWDDAQFRERIPAGAGFLTITRNSTGITSKGFELEVVATPAEGLLLGGNVGYADSTFDDGTIAFGDSRLCDLITDPTKTEFPLVPVTCVPIPGGKSAPDISGKQLLRTSKTTASAYGQYVRPAFANHEWLVRADVAYRSRMSQDLVNLQYSPERTMVSARIGLQSPNYDVMLWVENALDVDVVDTVSIFASDLNSFKFVSTGVGTNPRRFGVTARYRFGASVR